MIDWVSIVRHSRRRFSNYVGTRAPIRMKKRRRTPNPVPVSAPPAPALSTAHSPQDDRHQYTCCCTHVSYSLFPTSLIRAGPFQCEQCKLSGYLCQINILSITNGNISGVHNFSASLQLLSIKIVVENMLIKHWTFYSTESTLQNGKWETSS